MSFLVELLFACPVLGRLLTIFFSRVSAFFVLCIVVIVAVLLLVALFLLPWQTCDLVSCVLN